MPGISLLLRSFHLFLFIAFFWGVAATPLQAVAMEAESGGVIVPKQPLKIVSAVERTLDGRPALALVFNHPLDGKRRYDDFIEVAVWNKKKKTVEKSLSGAWVLGKNRHTLLFAGIEPKTTYRLRVVTGLTAAAGEVLTEPFSVDIKTRALEPAFGFASRGSVLPARLTGGLPIITVNVPEVDIQFLRVRPEKLGPFIKKFHWTGGGLHWDTALDPMHVFTESVHMDRFQTHGAANTRTITHIPVETIAPLRKPGLYVAILSRPNRFGKFKTSHFYVSDLGLHLRRYQNGSGAMDLFVNSLADGKAMDGVTVEIIDAKGLLLEKGTTDAGGHLRLHRTGKTDRLLLARKGPHLSILPFREPALDLSEFPITGPEQHAREVFIYGPRDLYRPGETVTSAFLLRDGDGRSVTAQPLTVWMRRPSGRVMTRKLLQPGEIGFYQWQVALPEDAPTGKWWIEARLDPGSKRPIGRFPFHVEAFLPERMKLTPRSEQKRLQPGEPFRIELEGAYLYGAPAAGNRLKAVMNLTRQPHPLPALKEFFFGDMDDPLKPQRRPVHDGPLDAKGFLNLSLMPLKQRPRSPLSVRVSASLFETGGRPVTRSIERTLWPDDTLVGVRPLFGSDDAPGDSTVQFEIIKVDVDGNRQTVTAVDALQATVIREERDYFWSFNEPRGWHQEYADAHYPIANQMVTLADGQRTLLDVEVTHGAYRLEIRDPQTGLKTLYRFYAGWNGRDRDASGHARPDRVNLSLDKKWYRSGESARLTIKPPHAGPAIILVEGERPLWRKRIDLPAAGGEVTIPLQKEWRRHDLYISAVVLRTGDAGDLITPNRALGLIHLPLDRNERQLPVTLEVPERIEPNRPLPVKVHLPGGTGKKIRVTVAAVDVGILNITGYETPDAFNHFFRKRRYGVEIRDLYGKVIENLAGKRAGMRYGGDAATKSRGKRPHGTVQTVALFSGPVTVDERGIAEVSLPLPDFNGALRVMALAFDEHRFGNAEEEIIVAAPLIVQMAAPRFLAAGDRSRLTLDLTNASDGEQKLDLSLTVTPPLALEPVSRSLTLKKNEKTTLHFPLGAQNRFGTGHIRLTVAGDGVDREKTWPLAVRPAYPNERRVHRFQLTSPSLPMTLPTQSLAGLLPATTEVELRVSSTPPINFKRAVEGLLTYPYGCLEQTVSRAMPLLHLDERRATALGLTEKVDQAERVRRLDKVFNRLVGMQRAGGGFGLWRAQDAEEPWLSAYAVDFLLDARDSTLAAHLNLPEEMLQKALKHLHKRLRGRQGFKNDVGQQHAVFAAEAYAAYVLARVGRAPLGTLRILHDKHRRQARSGLPLVHLGLALHLQGDQRRGDTALAEGVAMERAEGIYLDDYGSEVRDTAAIIALLARHEKTVPGADQLIFRLDRALSGRTWWSTQERFALFTVGESLAGGGKKWRAILTIGDHGPVRHAVEDDLTLRFTPETLTQGITLASEGAKRLFGSIETTGAGVEPPAVKRDLIEVARTIHTMDGKAVGNRPLKVGELLLVHLRVKSGTFIEHGLVVDLVPAGLEIENLNLSQGETLANVTIAGTRPARAMAMHAIRHVAFLDDRFAAAVVLRRKQPVDLFYLVRVVSPGTFQTPPPLAEDMYRPDRYGVGPVPGPTLVVE